MCVICCQHSQLPVITLHCSHEFHKTCIDDWGRCKNECPICRAAFDPNTYATTEVVNIDSSWHKAVVEDDTDDVRNMHFEDTFETMLRMDMEPESIFATALDMGMDLNLLYILSGTNARFYIMSMLYT
jgi:hypothetical protein